MSLKVPGWHLTQSDAADSFEYDPSLHNLQTLSLTFPESGEYFPFAQRRQKAEEVIAFAEEYLPAWHLAQSPLPSKELYVPGSHCRHVSELVAPSILTNFPTAHIKQTDAPSLSVYVPTAHGLHAMIELEPV
jgi:hypothetical protein